MNETFTASNGVPVRRTVSGTLSFASSHSLDLGALTGITVSQEQALREFFQHQRDKELGRWRWPYNPRYVVYPDGTSRRVVDEQTGRMMHVSLHDRKAMTTYLDSYVGAARGYDAAHHEPKPWHDAKQNELWELRIERCCESEVYRFTQDTTCADSGVFRPVNNPKRVFFDPKSPLIEAGRRIWPEVSDA